MITGLKNIAVFLLILALTFCFFDAAGQDVKIKKFTISGHADVDDLALRGEAFSNWNYGREIFLEAGYFVGLYDTHHGASLIRFNVSGIKAEEVKSAKLRLYKPKSMSQQGPVEVNIYKVSKKNGDWIEGGSVSNEEPAASCWNNKGNGKNWAGKPGCAEPGVDYEIPVIAPSVTVLPETSGWVEFNLPEALMQSWIDDPKKNSGLYITSQANPELADEAHFYSSEHPGGNGPELIIEAVKGSTKTTYQEWPANQPQFLPPVNAEGYEKWLAESKGRYHTWATGPEMSMTREQGVWPYYWDTQIRINILNNCFIPLAKSITRLQEFIARNNEKSIRDELDVIRLHLLKYEDVKSMYIHQSGPVAEILSSHQLGTMLGKEGFGVHAKDGAKKYVFRSPEEIEMLISKEINKYKEEWELSDSQVEIMLPYIRDFESKKWFHSNETGIWMRKVQSMLDEGRNDQELFEAARKLFYNHKMFVYWLSDFNTPKWNLWLNIVKAPPASVAREFLNAREDNYEVGKYEKELREIKEVYWYPPILYVNPDLTEVPLNGFGDRGLPFVNIDEALAVAVDGTEIRIAGEIDKSIIDLKGRKIVIADGFNTVFNSNIASESLKSSNNDLTKKELKAQKKKENVQKDLNPADNLKLLNQWGERPESVNELYRAAYEFFASKPLDATFSDLATDKKFKQLCKENNLTHLGGPMLGQISPTSVKVWIRTLGPVKVEVRLTIDGKEKIFGPVASTAETDLSAIVPVSNLKPGASYSYKVFIDGNPIEMPSDAVINTPLEESTPGLTRITFGTCFHRWGLGNQNQADAIVSRKPAAMLLGGDIAVQDKTNRVGLHRADYLLRDFFPAWGSLAATVPVYATWDDHDYFDNDLSGIPEGFTKQDKENVRRVFTHAWNNPSYGFGENGGGIFFRTRIGPADMIMLDERYFRTGEKGSFLGAEQMKWLKEQLLDCKGPFIILSNGTMWSDFVSNGKDSWGVNDPGGREQIFNLIEDKNIAGVLLISGDRHGARGFRIPRPTGFEFYEFEAGSLGGRTGPAPTNPEWKTQFYGISGKYAFGEFTFDTTGPDPIVTFRLIGENKEIIHELTLSRSQLTPKKK